MSLKRRNYDQRIREIEHGSFTPLVFSVADILNWLRCRLGFSLIRSAIMCLHGARSSHHHPPVKPDCAATDLALFESKVHN